MLNSLIFNRSVATLFVEVKNFRVISAEIIYLTNEHKLKFNRDFIKCD